VELLFGKLGALGTLFVGAFAYVAWQLKLEQDEHRSTMAYTKELNDQRLVLHKETLVAMGEIKAALIVLTEVVRRKRGGL